MKYDFDEIIPRRGTNSYKWDSAGDADILRMWVADMDFRTAPPVVEALRKRVEHGIFGYVRVPDAYYAAVTNWFARRHDWQIEKEWIIYTTGVVPALSAVWMDKVELPQIDCFNEYVSYEAWENDQIISQGTVIFSYPKYFHYLNPGLAVRVDGDEIVVKAEAYAKSVEIRNENDDLILEDNYFDMNAGEYRVKILDGKPDGLKVRSVYDI